MKREREELRLDVRVDGESMMMVRGELTVESREREEGGSQPGACKANETVELETS